MRQAKIYARIYGYAIPADAPQGSMDFTIEWKQISAPKRAGKTTFRVGLISSDDQIKSDLREQLADKLTVELGIEIKPRDIVGYSA